ncbi:MAG: dihydrodipicolinate synthase family protein [Clostridia bacterium]|nr:dihydrodipicolinate synthase family protein [Clostridia bacterium]
MAKIITPVVTILSKNEKPDYEGNKKVIDFLIKGGVDGILVLGSAGEFPNFSVSERLDFFKFYADYVNGRVELLAGTGCVNYEDTLYLSNAVYEMGYTPMIIGPYYFGVDQEKLFVYYDRLAKELKGDFYLYNYPQRTGHSIEPETIKRLLENNTNVIGLKDSVSEPGHTNMVFRAVEGHNFTVFSGYDDQFLSNIANNGGGGCIGAFSVIVPEIWSDLVRSANEGNFKKTQALFHLIQKLMPIYNLDTNCSLILKKLLVHRGVAVDDRAVFPFNQMSDEVFGKAKSILDEVLDEYLKVLIDSAIDEYITYRKGE